MCVSVVDGWIIGDVGGVDYGWWLVVKDGGAKGMYFSG